MTKSGSRSGAWTRRNTCRYNSTLPWLPSDIGRCFGTVTPERQLNTCVVIATRGDIMTWFVFNSLKLEVDLNNMWKPSSYLTGNTLKELPIRMRATLELYNRASLQPQVIMTHITVHNVARRSLFLCYWPSHMQTCVKKKEKGKAITVAGREGP
jgi:hypothetical protein